jgi:hypothetical protein
MDLNVDMDVDMNGDMNVGINVDINMDTMNVDMSVDVDMDIISFSKIMKARNSMEIAVALPDKQFKRQESVSNFQPRTIIEQTTWTVNNANIENGRT